jgi:RNA polymerase sigma-70 factor (ECF subfamily)
VELIFVLGWQNKDVARRMSLTEQAVANHKFFVVQKLREATKSSSLDCQILREISLE